MHLFALSQIHSLILTSILYLCMYVQMSKPVTSTATAGTSGSQEQRKVKRIVLSDDEGDTKPIAAKVLEQKTDQKKPQQPTPPKRKVAAVSETDSDSDSHSDAPPPKKKKQKTSEPVDFKQLIASWDIQTCISALPQLQKRVTDHKRAETHAKFKHGSRVKVRCTDGSFLNGTVTNTYTVSEGVQVLIDGRLRAQKLSPNIVFLL